MTANGHLFGVMRMCYTMTVVVVHECMQSLKLMYLKCGHFTSFKLKLNKTDKIEK